MSGEVLVIESDGGITIEQQTDILEIELMQNVIENTPDGSYWVRNGQREIAEYVAQKAKPDIDVYVEEISKPSIDSYVENGIKPTISRFVEEEVIPSIDDYVSDNILPPINQAVAAAAASQLAAAASATTAGYSSSISTEQAGRALNEANRAEEYANSINPEQFAIKSLSNTGMMSSGITVDKGISFDAEGKAFVIPAGTVIFYSSKNVDGKTISKTKTIENSHVGNLVATSGGVTVKRFLFYNPETDADIHITFNVYSSSVPPDNLYHPNYSGVWFNESENLYYYCELTLGMPPNWVIMPMVYLGSYVTNTNKIWNVFPNKDKLVTKDYLAMKNNSLSYFVQPANIFNSNVTITQQSWTSSMSGWIRLWGNSSTTDTVQIVVGNRVGALIGKAGGAVQDVFLPVRRGDEVTVKMSTGTLSTLSSRFFPLESELC